MAKIRIKYGSTDTDAVARLFVFLLSNYIASDDRAEIAKRNLEEENPGICHTHDFCDANVFMDEAFKVNGLEIDPTHHVHSYLWDAAWRTGKQIIQERWTRQEVTA